MVVEHHDLAVAGQAHVAFDARAGIQCSAKGSQAIFGDAGAVESAMRKPHGPRI
jgi:hypothetical protein